MMQTIGTLVKDFYQGVKRTIPVLAAVVPLVAMPGCESGCDKVEEIVEGRVENVFEVEGCYKGTIRDLEAEYCVSGNTMPEDQKCTLELYGVGKEKGSMKERNGVIEIDLGKEGKRIEIIDRGCNNKVDQVEVRKGYHEVFPEERILGKTLKETGQDKYFNNLLQEAHEKLYEAQVDEHLKRQEKKRQERINERKGEIEKLIDEIE